jgi:1-acyl-sn-glycerol-3-phosphate acyltransferase
VIRRRVTFVAKAEYFDDKKTAWFFRGVGQIPIRREGGSASERALESATAVLEQGGVFGIYPEGTRTRDGYLHRGHTGVARLALRTGAPIVPVGMTGTDEINPIDRKLPRLFRTVRIQFGTPIAADRYAGREHDKLVLRQITDEVMFELQQLSGYEYADTYATKKAEDVPVEPVPLATLETAGRSAAVA